MTAQEAIDWLKKLYLLEDEKEIRVDAEKLDEAVAMAIEALEKQVPKKPKIIENKFSKSHTCPYCDLELIRSDETGWFAGRRYKHCPDCSQKLDWGE